MRLVFPIVLIVAVALLLIGSSLYEYDLENNEFRDIYNLTESTLIWNFNYTESVITNFSDSTSIQVGKVGRLSNVVYKLTDFVGYSSMEIGKYFVEFGYTHPEIDYQLIFTLIKYYLIILLVSVIVPIVIPLIVLVYLIVVGIKKLINKLRKKKNDK